MTVSVCHLGRDTLEPLLWSWFLEVAATAACWVVVMVGGGGGGGMDSIQVGAEEGTAVGGRTAAEPLVYFKVARPPTISSYKLPLPRG